MGDHSALVNALRACDVERVVDLAEMEQSFELAFDDLFEGAFRLAYRLLGDAASAEDVAAEACARAFARWKQISELPHRDAWVMRVASNFAIDMIRRRRRTVSSVDRTADMEDSVALRMALGAALRALPRRQREVVVLRHLAGLREAEVAELLGVSAGTVKTHTSRGLAALRGRLGEEMWEETQHA